MRVNVDARLIPFSISIWIASSISLSLQQKVEIVIGIFAISIILLLYFNQIYLSLIAFSFLATLIIGSLKIDATSLNVANIVDSQKIVNVEFKVISDPKIVLGDSFGIFRMPDSVVVNGQIKKLNIKILFTEL